MLAEIRYFVKRTWRHPGALFLYLLVYRGKTLLTVAIAANFVLFAKEGFTKAGLVLSVFGVAIASFNLGFALRDVMPGPPPGKRR